MYCVLCGVFLQDNNQEGILCHDCKQTQKGNRTIRGLVIRVDYCYACGQPYRPADASIWHVTCFAGGMNKRIICSIFDRTSSCSWSVLDTEK